MLSRLRHRLPRASPPQYQETRSFRHCGHAAKRMRSLLPRPLGTGVRNNEAKNGYCRVHINDLEYRTMACVSKDETLAVEKGLRANSAKYESGT